MLDYKSRASNSVERPVAAGATITAEGTPLVYDSNSGITGVKPCSATAGEKFVGVSFAQQLSLLALPKVQQFTVPATPFQVTLDETPIAASYRLYDETQAQALTDGNPATTADNYSISGKVVTFHSGQEGSLVTAYYRYVPTTVQARSIQGDVPPGEAAALTLGSVGVITSGDIWTTEFNTAVDWNAASVTVTLGAGGLFTIGGTGTVVPNAYVLEVPTVDNPFLGIHFTA